MADGTKFQWYESHRTAVLPVAVIWYICHLLFLPKK